MKKVRVIIAGIMVCLIVVGWVKWGLSGIKTQNYFLEYVENANQYMDEKLYQKAIQEYEKALDIEENSEIRHLLINAYSCSYENGFSSFSEYTKALNDACAVDKMEVQYWKQLLQIYVDSNRLTNAYTTYNSAIKALGGEEYVREYKDIIPYSFTLKNTVYSDFYRSPSGIYALKRSGWWGILDANEKWVYELEYSNISPMNDSGEVILIKEDNGYLVDGNKIVENYIPEFKEKILAYGDGWIPVINGEACNYYDVQNKQFADEEFAKVSSFQNKKAFVFDGARWIAMDTNLSLFEDQTYDDLKIYSNGNYMYDSMITGCKEGQFGLYDENGNAVMTIQCCDMDNYFGDYIAYQNDSGKWGYVNKKGEVVIEPKFESAKSFSNGLAAVSDGEYWGFIDHSGDVVIKCQFIDADYFTKQKTTLVKVGDDAYQLLKLRF